MLTFAHRSLPNVGPGLAPAGPPCADSQETDPRYEHSGVGQREAVRIGRQCGKTVPLGLALGQERLGQERLGGEPDGEVRQNWAQGALLDGRAEVPQVAHERKLDEARHLASQPHLSRPHATGFREASEKRGGAL